MILLNKWSLSTCAISRHLELEREHDTKVREAPTRKSKAQGICMCLPEAETKMDCES